MRGLIEKMRHLSWPTSFSLWRLLLRLGNEIPCSGHERARRSRESRGKSRWRRRGVVINGVRVPWLVLPPSYSSRRSSYLIALTSLQLTLVIVVGEVTAYVADLTIRRSAARLIVVAGNGIGRLSTTFEPFILEFVLFRSIFHWRFSSTGCSKSYALSRKLTNGNTGR